MNTRSPSRILGFMEPVGTSFQSARDERMEKRTSVRTSRGRISLRHQRRARCGNVSAFIRHLTWLQAGRSKAARLPTPAAPQLGAKGDAGVGRGPGLPEWGSGLSLARVGGRRSRRQVSNRGSNANGSGLLMEIFFEIRMGRVEQVIGFTRNDDAWQSEH